jgi:hypothetical protein
MAGRYLLTDRRCKVETKTGLHADGAGLYLTVKAGRKGWAFMSQRGGGRVAYGLGGYPSISLAKARREALTATADHYRALWPAKFRRTDGTRLILKCLTVKRFYNNF